VCPRADDLLLPKRHASAFFGTPLASYLIDLKIDTLILAGCTTSGCVRATAVDAFSYNFPVLIPVECVYDRTETSHTSSLFDLDSKYSDVLEVSTIIQYLDDIHSYGHKPRSDE
jgi:nicotinamidase-related amidase